MYWKNKKVVVTGGCGFIAHHLVPLLKDAGANVTIITRTNACPGAQVRVLYYDVGDIDSCKQAFKDAEVVFNLAAVVAGQRDMMSHQARHFLSNVTSQCAAAIAAFEVGVPVFVQVSSVSAYDPKYSTMAIESNANLGSPVYGYGFAKRMGEQTVKWLCESREWKAVIARLTNMYGIHDHYNQTAHVVPFLIDKFATSNDEPIVLYGNGRGTRDLMYAEDGARGLMAAAELGRPGRLYNFGTGVETTIADLAQKIKTLVGSKSPIEFSDPTRVVDERRCTIADRAWRELHWRYHISLDEGLARAVKWYFDERN